MATKSSEHIVVSVHGIRTYGRWQEELECLIKEREPEALVFNYNYGYFSILAFLFPPLRWITTLRFGEWLRAVLASHPKARVDIVAHSFGTHLVGWSLQRLAKKSELHVHTVILAGSVLKPSFPWDALMQPSRVYRVVNECGTRDNVLIVNQLFVLFTGLAGRVGFVAGTGERFRNRYFRFGHSGYFRDETGKLSKEFMQKQWIPLLTSAKAIPLIDERFDQPSVLDGLLTFLLSNTEPIKIAAYASPFVALALTYMSLYGDAQAQAYRANIAATESRVRLGDYRGAREFLEATVPDLRGWEARYLKRVLDRSLNRGSVEDLPAEMTGAWRSSWHHIRYQPATVREPAGLYDSATNSMLAPSLLPPDLRRDDSVSASPDRRKLAVWRPGDIEVRSLDGRTTSFVVKFSEPTSRVSAVGPLGFSQDGRLLAVLGSLQEVWQVSNLGNVRRRPLEKAVESWYGPKSASIFFGPMSETLVYLQGMSFHIWDITSGALDFSTSREEPKLVPGLSYYLHSYSALAFDTRGETIFLAFSGAKSIDAQVSDLVTVLATGTRTSEEQWIFEERLITNDRLLAISEGISDPERLVFSTSNAILGFAHRDFNQVFRIPVPSEMPVSPGVVSLGYDANSDRYITWDDYGTTRTWDLRSVISERMMFAAREWGYSYPISGPHLSLIDGMEATGTGEGVYLFGVREDYIPFILEHGLLDRSFIYYDLPGAGANDLHLESLLKWKVIDVQESLDGARLYALTLKLGEDSSGYENPYDWDDYPDGAAAYLVSWDRTTGRQIAHWRLHPNPTVGPNAPQVRFAELHDGFTILDSKTGDEIMRSFYRDRTAAVISPDGTRMVEQQGTNLLLWDTATNEALLTLQSDELVNRVVWTQNGRWLVGASARFGESIIQVWDSAP